MPRTVLVIAALTTLWLSQSSPPTASPSQGRDVDFPPASPESQGLSDVGLRSLASAVRGHLERDEISGAELLVIKNRHTILHEAFGWRDRDQKIPMERNTIFNVRSMTKPLTGTAAQMLIDRGGLRLEDRVSTRLQSFANDKCREITVEQLLTHRSGLPLIIPVEEEAGQTPTTILKKYKRQAEIVDLIARRGPETRPGQFFQYSDAGSEALGALVSEVAGQPLGEFIKDRIFVPLKMADAMMPLDPSDHRAKRTASAYLGVPGNWVPYWRAASSPIYPFAMGSQSLYCTPLDYARFLALWMDEGTVGGRRILSQGAVHRALTPLSDLEGYGTGFSGMKVRYGQMWMLFVPQEEAGAAKPVLFGHGGSDGTMAWAWPELDLMILYFTQNRGTSTVFSLEREIERLIINPSSPGPAGDQAEELKFYVGAYALKTQPSELFVTTAKDGILILETPRGTKIELRPPDAERIWRFSLAPNQGVKFSGELQGGAASLWIVDPLPLRRGDEMPPQESAGGSATLEEYLGTYVLPAGVGQRLLKYWIVEENGGLVFRSERGSRFGLRPSDNLGRWYLIELPNEYLTFERNAEGNVIACTLYQMHECVRTAAPGPPELSLDQARRYLGRYFDAAANVHIEIIYENGRLAVRNPTLPSPVALRPTGRPNVFSVPINPSVSVRFNEDANGNIVSHTVVAPGGEYERPRVKFNDNGPE